MFYHKSSLNNNFLESKKYNFIYQIHILTNWYQLRETNF